MVSLKHSEMRILDSVFEMGAGFVLNFSNRTFAEFFEDEFGVDIYNEKYAARGVSKAKRVKSFIEIEDTNLVAQLFRKLWDYKNSYGEDSSEKYIRDKDRLFGIIDRLELGLALTTPAHLRRLSSTANIINFDTVSRDLDRALEAADKDPESAITSACSTVESVCRSILIEMGEGLPAKKDVKSLFNAVKKPLGLSPDKKVNDELVADDVRKVLGGIATVVEGIAALRTHAGDAHGRESGYKRVDTRIANLAVNSASTISLFLIETWQKKFPEKELSIYSSEMIEK